MQLCILRPCHNTSTSYNLISRSLASPVFSAMAPTTTADLIFSEQANHNFSKTLGDLKRHNLSITNRLNSIIQDAVFVQTVKTAWQRPLIANERCGSWYIDPASKDGSAYFKSTDGHTGNWKFSTRRLNLHLLEIIGKHDGWAH
jgi:tRNA A64-2'-O-ribosylphosphate transferase